MVPLGRGRADRIAAWVKFAGARYDAIAKMEMPGRALDAVQYLATPREDGEQGTKLITFGCGIEPSLIPAAPRPHGTISAPAGARPRPRSLRESLWPWELLSV